MIGLFFGNLAVSLAVLTGLAAIMLALPALRTTLAIVPPALS